ncbi:MAG: hypothetical protein ACQER9_00065 [Nanobdellota archaeon]
MKNKKAMEMKILMTWLFIILAALVFLVLIGIFSKKGFEFLDVINNIF